jgi:hypothetical protein
MSQTQENKEAVNNELSTIDEESQTTTLDAQEKEPVIHELSAELIVSLAKHNENHAEALKETVSINHDITILNQSIIVLRRRILYN